MRLIDADHLLRPKNEKMVGGYAFDLIKCLVQDEPTVCDIEQIRAEAYKQGYEDAMKQTAELDSAYMKGFEDGKNSR